ncbi:MAG: D-glycero-beta-D-manno-heptose-7-phosphate kinase [Nanoarchaeota archaeon]|nr:D-glycero-beta-D-manno-heptose-7-phosphate kinase [Nanoarchaeota archaeon]
MKDKLLGLLEGFKQKKILVVGDVMLDVYLFGDVTRVSPEAPVQVVRVLKEAFIPGGAANVASNVASLGGQVFVAGVIGNDGAGVSLTNGMLKRRIDTHCIIQDASKPTTKKTRIMAQNQQLIRYDHEKDDYLSADVEKMLLDKITPLLKDIDAIIISDYAKGVITKNVLDSINKLTDAPIIVDPKPKHSAWYAGARLITPNIKEAQEMVAGENEIAKIGNALVGQLGADVLITMGERGMGLFQKNADYSEIPTKAKEVYDVSGAGDTVVATLALALTAGADLNSAALLANHAAGIVVGKIGTSSCSLDQLREEIEHAY